MLKDIHTSDLPNKDDLSVEPNHEVIVILNFIDRHISGFCSYYYKFKVSDRENSISYYVCTYFNACFSIDKDDNPKGFFPFNFNFIKNPPQDSSSEETDVGVVVSTLSKQPIPVIEFEAKRMYKSSHVTDYVYGAQGGIERFKRSLHAPKLKICGMLGYLQSKTPNQWIDKVNNWINEKSQSKEDIENIDWQSIDERLTLVKEFDKVIKLRSEHTRKLSNDTIILYHYFIELQ